MILPERKLLKTAPQRAQPSASPIVRERITVGRCSASLLSPQRSGRQDPSWQGLFLTSDAAWITAFCGRAMWAVMDSGGGEEGREMRGRWSLVSSRRGPPLTHLSLRCMDDGGGVLRTCRVWTPESEVKLGKWWREQKILWLRRDGLCFIVWIIKLSPKASLVCRSLKLRRCCSPTQLPQHDWRRPWWWEPPWLTLSSCTSTMTASTSRRWRSASLTSQLFSAVMSDGLHSSRWLKSFLASSYQKDIQDN